MKRHLIASLMLVALTGCTSFGTNVRGSFNCSAPNGTCAPSTVIDDQALALIANDRGALRPAGPFERSPQAPSLSVAGATPQAGVTRRTLAIRIMPRIDELGVQHDAHLVHVALPSPTSSPAMASVPVTATARPVTTSAVSAVASSPAQTREEIIRQSLAARSPQTATDVRPVLLAKPPILPSPASTPSSPITLPRPITLPPTQLSAAEQARGSGAGPTTPTTASPPAPARISPPTIFSTDN